MRRRIAATRGAARHNSHLPADAPTLNFWPMRPVPIAPIYQIMQRLGLRAGFEPRGDQPTMAWETGTYLTPGQAGRLPANAINRNCRDISKSRVAEVWGQVAGYPLALDPLTTVGPLVEKPEVNAVHGGRILQGPIARRRKGYTYQRLVDCRIDGKIQQLRAVVTGSRLALAYLKWRPEPDWFGGTRISIPHDPSELFNDDEQALLLRFAVAMNLEYGELDVLRDQPTGLIYVVDANRTPTRAYHLPNEVWPRVYETQAMAFRELLAPWGLAQVELRDGFDWVRSY
jgi:hypothetical protein